jgi:beta-phosphoglucomutase
MIQGRDLTTVFVHIWLTPLAMQIPPAILFSYLDLSRYKPNRSKVTFFAADMIQSSPTVTGILFDMDGVLVNSNPIHKKVIEQFCAGYGHAISDSFFLKEISGRKNSEWIPLVFPCNDAGEIEQLAHEKEKLFREVFDPVAAATPGLLLFLEALRDNNVPMAVATSAPEANAVFILERLGITGYFDEVLHSDHVNEGKPHPEIYIKAAKTLGLEPGSCVVFEDSVAGVAAGLRAGARVVGVTGTHTREELSDCHRVIADFNEITPAEVMHL